MTQQAVAVSFRYFVGDALIVDSQLPDPGEPSWMRLPWDRLGLVLGPAAMLAWIVWGPSESVTPEAHRLGGVLLLTIIWWLTEPIPIPATGLLAVVLAVMVGAVPGDRPPAVGRARAVRQSDAVLSAGRNVHRPRDEPPWARSAHRAVDPDHAAGPPHSPTTLLAAVGLSVMLISMWISNTAATAMIYPVTLGIIGVLAAGMETGCDVVRALALCVGAAADDGLCLERRRHRHADRHHDQRRGDGLLSPERILRPLDRLRPLERGGRADDARAWASRCSPGCDF